MSHWTFLHPAGALAVLANHPFTSPLYSCIHIHLFCEYEDKRNLFQKGRLTCLLKQAKENVWLEL